MPTVRAMRLLNAIEAGTLSGSAMESLLTADAGRLAEWNVLLGMRGQTRRMAASSTAMAAVAASSTAMAAVAASSTAMTAVAASSTAMTAVIASSTAMAAVWASNTASDAVLTSSTAKLAVYNADAALAALQANPTQIQRQIDLSGRVTLSSNPWSAAVTLVANGTPLILLRRYYSASEYDCINWARGSTTTGAAYGPMAGSGGRTLYSDTTALGCVSGTYTSTGALPANDATGNFVSAANGLRRNFAGTGAIQYVYYIPV